MQQGPTKNLETQMLKAAKVPVDGKGPPREVSACLVPVVPVDFVMLVAAPTIEVPALLVDIAVVAWLMVYCWSLECRATVVVAPVEEVEMSQQVVAVVQQVFGPLEMIHSPEAAVAAEVVAFPMRPLVARQPT